MRKEKQLREECEELNKKYLKLYEEKSELDYELSMLKEETEHMKQQDNEVRALHQNVRQLKHDMKNHLMVIASYINDEDYIRAREYTSEIIGKLNAMHSYIETGNSLLNHIVNEKLEYARGHNVDIKAQIENLQFKNISSAIEASIKEETGCREIHITITGCRGYETICVKNRIGISVLNCNPNLESTKEEKDNHGLGMSKIKSIVDQCGGMCDIYEDDGFFCIKVFIHA